MRRIPYFLFVIVVTVATARGGEGPFGLEKGMSLEEVTAVLGEAPSPGAKIGDKKLLYGYSVNCDRELPGLDMVILTIVPEAGLCEIYLQLDKFPRIPVDTDSPDPKEVYTCLAELVTARYGPPRKKAHLPEGEVNFDEILPDLLTFWSPARQGLESISLSWKPDSSPGSFINLLYVFENRNRAIREYPRREQAADVTVRP